MSIYEFLVILNLVLLAILFFWLRKQLRLLKEGMNSVARFRVIKPEKITVVKGDLKECDIKTGLVIMQSDYSGGMIMNCHFVGDVKSESAAIQVEGFPFPKEKKPRRERRKAKQI